MKQILVMRNKYVVFKNIYYYLKGNKLTLTVVLTTSTITSKKLES